MTQGGDKDESKTNWLKEDLLARERQFSLICDNINDVIFSISIEPGERFRFASVNRSFLQVTGLPEEKVVGRLIEEVIPEPAQTMALENYKRAIRSKQSVHWEEVSEYPAGTKVGDVYIYPVLDKQGNCTQLVGVIHDITERKQAEELLRQSELKYRELVENANSIILHWTHEGVITFLNEYGLHFFGYTPEEIVGSHVMNTIVPVAESTGRDLRQLMEQICANPEAYEHNVNENLRSDGKRIWIAWTNKILLGTRGNVEEILSIGSDITEVMAAENKIKRLNRVLAVLSQTNSLIVRARDREELFSKACKIATNAGGFRMALIALADKASGRIVPVASEGDRNLLADISKVLASDERASTTLAARAIREKRAFISNAPQYDPALVFRNRYAESGINSISVLPLVVSGEAIGVFVLFAPEGGFFREEEMQMLAELTHNVAFAIDHLNKQKQLHYLAYYDALTGLANRSLFLERVGQFIRNIDAGQKLALFVIDLERFKSINDSLGRTAGDELLARIASWLTEYIKDASLLARIGSDHFAVVMPEVRQNGDVARLVESTLSALQGKTFVLNGSELRLSAKAGIALFPDDGNDAEALFNNAETALKAAKKNGNRYLFHTKDMTESVAARLALENRLRKAIDNEEFVLHYQPKVNPVNGSITAAEALIRWNDPGAGLVFPDQFIHVLEDIGMIHEVGRWALRQAIADGLRWRKAGLSAVCISVNVSPLQLRSPAFVAEIEQAIGIDPQAAEGLQLEITESMVMEDIQRSINMLQTIRDMGVTIAIDDFGMGFSSLGQLVKLPLDTLKIDRAFVNKMTEDPKELALVSAIINLAHSLDLNVVAEGVELEEQSRLLHLLGCNELQGFLFSRPVPSEVFEKQFLQNGQV